MMADKCYIKKDDKVKVIAGKDKGKIGKVLKVNRKKGGLLAASPPGFGISVRRPGG